MSLTATVYSEALPGADSVMRCQLVVIDGPDTGRAVHITDQPVVIGSAQSADLVLTDDGVSQRHAEVARTEDGFVVTDLGSKNGVV